MQGNFSPVMSYIYIKKLKLDTIKRKRPSFYLSGERDREREMEGEKCWWGREREGVTEAEKKILQNIIVVKIRPTD